MQNNFLFANVFKREQQNRLSEILKAMPADIISIDGTLPEIEIRPRSYPSSIREVYMYSEAFNKPYKIEIQKNDICEFHEKKQGFNPFIVYFYQTKMGKRAFAFILRTPQDTSQDSTYYL